MDPVKKTYLDVSTANITKEDAELLDDKDQSGASPIVVFSYEYGFFIPVPENDEESDVCAALSEAGFSRAFVGLIAAAHATGAKLLRIDRDAPVADLIEDATGFRYSPPAFDW